MAAPKAQNASAASPVSTGGILVGPFGTAVPTDATTAVNAAIVALGYVGREGLRPVGSAPSFNDIFAWGGDLIDAPMESKGTTEFEFDLLEVMNPEVAKLVFGDSNVTTTPATALVGTTVSILEKGFVIPRKVVVFDMLYGGKKLRFAGSNAQLTKMEEGAYQDANIGYYRMRAKFFPNAAGVSLYRYLVNDDKTA